MAGYSGTPLAAKLGIKPGTTLLPVSPPRHYAELLAPMPDGASIDPAAAAPDIIHLFVTRRDELGGLLRRHRGTMAPAASLWVSWPKKAAKVETDVTEEVIRQMALPLGLVDVKVCAVDEVWSGLKLVIRKELR